MAIASFLLVNRFSVSAGDDTSKRLITVHDRGERKVFLSNAATIGDALEEAGIEVDKRDAVEPSLREDMVAPEYQVNIYRARPVVVIDGQVKQRVITPYQTASQIAADADISLRAEDNVELQRSEDIVTDGAGLQLVIDRATDITIDLYGTASTVLTQGETVGEVLVEKGIELHGDDRVAPASDVSVSAGMNIRVWREGIQTVTKEESIDFEVKRIYDIDRAVGYKDVKVKGEMGVRSVTYEVNIKDGQEISRKQIAELVTKQPVAQEEVVGVGGGAKTTASQNEAISWQFFMDQGFSVEQTAGI
ncbi:MAG TPA: ubiquitin-like domain-containing protein, partial [Candidatus Saccharibacteria bacterium]|nr:ubiquitin-like domain-containing protein [Candidatus Saccharibacteria bacterium]